jgi:exodeoxyribonuclease-3
MKIISWNVNGLRASAKKGSFDWLVKQNVDIFCLQETKSDAHQLPDDVRSPVGYHSFFNSSKARKGYSGVAIYSKIAPNKVEYGFGGNIDLDHMDQEGRLISAYFDDFVLLNCYFPNGGGGPVRLAYKMEFYKHFLDHIKKLTKKGYNVIFCGDVNTAHSEIDLARPKENEKNTGFLPMERAWIDHCVSAGYVDVWRELNPNKKDVYSYWDQKSGARARNVGWRIDYFFVERGYLKEIEKMEILTDIPGSDHCPLLLHI